MASANRPRPRPRPRPKPRAPSLERAAPAPVAGTSSLDGRGVDSDEMFMRNRNRTTNAWAALDKLTKEAKTARHDDSDEEIATPRRKKARGKDEWQNKKHITRQVSPLSTPSTLTRHSLLSHEIPSSDDNEDGGGDEIVSTTTPRAPTVEPQRARSITPPPELPRHQIQHMRALVERTLNAAAPPARARDDDDEAADDALFANPELARLARSVGARAPPRAASPAPDGARETVQVAVRWQPHPLDPEGKAALWLFKIYRDENFQDLFEAAAEEACVRVENLILTYEGRRIYASVTPMTFQMRGEVELVGCDKVTYEYMRTHPINATPEIPDAPPSHDDDEESDADGETFKLVLRSSLTNDITLTVRPTTKCGAIVKAYLKKAGLAGTDARLCVDGDKMGHDAEIGDADLDDGDMVEVVGL
ncbi:hypothetical protein C0993_005448 [Termitomyces sp. T159_Od127]|nr:hypothetical protein C0993_005448 [Termitomyces sp. T159_Od127]